jgi:hypothetical protein
MPFSFMLMIPKEAAEAIADRTNSFINRYLTLKATVVWDDPGADFYHC